MMPSRAEVASPSKTVPPFHPSPHCVVKSAVAAYHLHKAQGSAILIEPRCLISAGFLNEIPPLPASHKRGCLP